MEFINKNKLLVTITAVLSALLSFWSVHMDPVINMDATLYLSVAQEFADNNIQNAFALYKWPFYPALIAATHSISGASLQNSAYLLNGILQALATIGFLACVHALGGNKRTLLIAALVILIFPSINKYRSFIIRDIGFIACYLWAIFYLIRGLNTHKFSYYILSGSILLCGALFRIEAIAPLAIIPTYLLYIQSKTKLSRYMWLALTIFSSLVLFCGLSVWLFGETSVLASSSISSFFTNSVQHAFSSLTFRVQNIREEVLNALSQKYAPMIFIVSVTLIVVYEPIRRLAFFYAYLAWYAIRNKLVLNKPIIRKAFFALCTAQIALMAIFAIINMFLVSRHTLALVLTILLLTPFSIEHLFDHWNTSKKNRARLGLPILAALLLAIGIEGLDVRTKKSDIINAGKWVSDIIEPQYSIYSNNPLLLHYANRKPAYYNLKFSWKETDHLIFTSKIFDFDYIIIEVEEDDTGAEQYLSNKLFTTPAHKHKLHTNKLLLVYDLRKTTPNQELGPEFFKIKQ